MYGECLEASSQTHLVLHSPKEKKIFRAASPPSLYQQIVAVRLHALHANDQARTCFPRKLTVHLAGKDVGMEVLPSGGVRVCRASRGRRVQQPSLPGV